MKRWGMDRWTMDGRLMRRFVLGASAGWLLTAAAPANTAFVQIQSVPADADVYLDGEFRGQTPLALADLAPGTYRLTLRKSQYREFNQTLDLAARERRSIEPQLDPVLGLVLVHSEPPGAEIFVDGAVVGQTPALVDHLPAGRYRVRFNLPGFQSRELDLQIEDRTPQRLHTAMVADSAALSVATTPPEADISVNGIPRGSSPLTVQRIPEGTVRIEVTLDGYQTFAQTLQLSAGEHERLDIALAPLPAGLRVESQPDGARVYLDNQFQGVAPLAIEDLAPARYRLRVEMRGHDPMARDVTLRRGETRTEEFRLTLNTGRLELTTQPAGVTVFVDGRNVGMTPVPAAGSDQVSSPLAIETVEVGTREIRLTRPGYYEQSFPLAVERGKTHTMHRDLQRRFIPNYEVATAHRVYRGVLDSITRDLIRVETAPGVMNTIPLRDVRYHRPLREEDLPAEAVRPE